MSACGVCSKFIPTHEPSVVVANYVKVSSPKVMVRINVPQNSKNVPHFPGQNQRKSQKMTPRVVLATKLLRTVTYPVCLSSEARTAIAPFFASPRVG
jgi:hypothetical protein